MLLQPVMEVVGLSAVELEELASALKSDKLSTGGHVSPYCEEIGVPLTSMPAGTGPSAPLEPCSGGQPISHDAD